MIKQQIKQAKNTIYDKIYFDCSHRTMVYLWFKSRSIAAEVRDHTFDEVVTIVENILHVKK